MAEQTPFLERIRRKQRGSLKLYIGMAAGVGKTYRMLQEAHSLLRKGCDVVVGLVVTHGRAETQRLVEGLPVSPLRTSFYQGKELEELDLEGLIRRRPEIVIVDELAHTNIPGSKNTKRWQDVIDLLEEGINVISAVNIQHIESLNDPVRKITGIEVAERVPDRILLRADEVVNIDVPADELIERLRDGKIYRPDRVQAALANFFRHENLLQLREMAMREVANRLEKRIESSLNKENRNTLERICLAISTNEASARHMLRRVARMASFLDAQMQVVYVQTAREAPDKVSLAAQRHLINNFRLATELGATVQTIKSNQVAKALTAYAKANEITLIVIGKTRRNWWQMLLFGDIARELVKQTSATTTDVLIIGQ